MKKRSCDQRTGDVAYGFIHDLSPREWALRHDVLCLAAQVESCVRGTRGLEERLGVQPRLMRSEKRPDA
ncbi:MAG: hypothetical protein E6R07_07535 [Nevskiaceae bacterium]|nr:MAG: hypothetical protein E6R07_07535 [Nevskiaceae bacterium]